MTMSYSDYKARELWKRFMPRRKEVLNTLGLLLDAIVQSYFFTIILILLRLLNIGRLCGYF
jgi:hypothetical protein